MTEEERPAAHMCCCWPCWRAVLGAVCADDDNETGLHQDNEEEERLELNRLRTLIDANASGDGPTILAEQAAFLEATAEHHSTTIGNNLPSVPR